MQLFGNDEIAKRLRIGSGKVKGVIHKEKVVDPRGHILFDILNHLFRGVLSQLPTLNGRGEQ